MTPPKWEGRPTSGAALKSAGKTTNHSVSLASDEIPPTSPLTEPEASRLTTRIQNRLEMIAGHTEIVVPMIVKARNGDAHIALGYASWTAYFADKFGGALARLAKVERIPFVELLAEQGMSTRAIASVVGVNASTVSRDLASGSPVADATPDHRDADASVSVPDHKLDDIFVMADGTEDEAALSARAATKVVGMDGKTYRPRAEPKARRSSLPDAYRHAIYDLQKAVERLERLHADDRFLVNRKALCDREAGQLGQLANRLADICNDLDDVANKCTECTERLVPGEGAPLRNWCSGGCR